jgi:hypothetical protein
MTGVPPATLGPTADKAASIVKAFALVLCMD